MKMHSRIVEEVIATLHPENSEVFMLPVRCRHKLAVRNTDLQKTL